MIFWNGNKSLARQGYELEVLQAALAAAGSAGEFRIITEDRTDYPLAEDEGNIFALGADILVTVAGNPKFAGKEKIVIPHAVDNGLLGKRLLVVRRDCSGDYATIRLEREIKEKVAGIPATWADVAIFRANGYRFVERGTFGEIFTRLRRQEFDYVSLGAFEVEDILNRMAKPHGDLVIESCLLLSYPMPLVFYVHPEKADLAQRLEAGIRAILSNGELDAIFQRLFGAMISRLSLESRRVFHLKNPLLPGPCPTQ